MMSDQFSRVLSDPGPHTARSLAERLPDFPLAAIREALEALAAQGVLSKATRPDGEVEYRYLAPERYAQANLDVARDPGRRFNQKSR